MQRCERCDLLIGAGCACTSTSTPTRRPYESTYSWPRFGPDTLLISSRNMAHIPGACDHVTEDYVLNPKNGWGWIPNPDPAIWDRISTSTPARPPRADTTRAATIRCSSCSATLQS